MQIGNKGLEKVNLIIPQWTTLTFDIVHKTEEGGGMSSIIPIRIFT